MPDLDNWISPILCGIDAELTGFDPQQDELIELGLVFFRLSRTGVVIDRERSWLFRPKKTVRTRVLGLTGIEDEDLKSAPLLSKVFLEIQAELEGARLVGHNLAMDLKFLDAAGFPRPYKEPIDTLQLVQILLPTFHSYNLEHLTHALDFVPSRAHRALDDAKACAWLLFRLLSIYQGYSENLHKDLPRLAEDFSWSECLGWPIVSSVPPSLTEPDDSFIKTSDSVNFPGEGVWNMPVSPWSAISASTLSNFTSKPIVVVDRSINNLFALWRAGKLQLVVRPRDLLNQNKLDGLLRAPEDLNNSQKMAAMKLSVWKHENWQTITPLDLNVSFSGQEALGLVTDRSAFWSLSEPQERILGMDFETAKEALLAGRFSNYLWFFKDLTGFEYFLTNQQTHVLSWQGLIRQIREYGDTHVVGSVDLLVEAVDLFFGTLAVTLKSLSLKDLRVGLRELSDYHLSRLHQAALRLAGSLSSVHDLYGRLPEAALFLSNFFLMEPEFAKWIEVNGTMFSLRSRQISVQTDILKAFKKLQISGFLPNIQEVSSYIVNRLSLDGTLKTADFDRIAWEVVKGNAATDLESELAVILKDLPGVIVLPDQISCQDFYEVNYKRFHASGISVFMHGYTGGIGKIMKNFGLKKQSSLLITTPEILVKSPVSLTCVSVLYQNCQEPAALLHPYDLAVAEKMGLEIKDLAQVNWKSIHWQALSKIQPKTLKQIRVVEKTLQKAQSFLDFLMFCCFGK